MTPTRVRLAGGIAVLLALVGLSGLLPPASLEHAVGVDLPVAVPGSGRSLLLCPIGTPKSASTLDLGVYPTKAPAGLTGQTKLDVRQMSGGDDPSFDDLDVAITGRGRSVARRLDAGDDVGLVLDASGRLAAGLWASVASRAAKGESAGLAIVDCLATKTEFVFTGLSERQGQHAQIQLVNPDQAEARVDLQLYDTDGPLPDADSRRGISVPGGDRRTLDLDDLAAGSSALVARVEVSAGRVAAFALQSARTGETAGGADWAAPGEVGTALVLPGVAPSVGGVRLTLATLGDDSGTASVEVIDSNGAHRPAGDETVRLSPGQVKDVDLSAAFDGEAASVRVTGDVDLTAGLSMTAGRRLTSGDAPRPGDLAFAAAASRLAGAVVFAGRAGGTKTAVQLTALGKDTSVVVRLREHDGSVVSSRTVELEADTTSRVDLGTTASGKQVVVSPADPDVVVAAAIFEAAGRQPQFAVVPLG